MEFAIRTEADRLGSSFVRETGVMPVRSHFVQVEGRLALRVKFDGALSFIDRAGPAGYLRVMRAMENSSIRKLGRFDGETPITSRIKPEGKVFKYAKQVYAQLVAAGRKGKSPGETLLREVNR
jgi:hypothetical protein